MAVFRLSESCMCHTLMVRRGLSDIKSSNSGGQILEAKESNKKNTILIYIPTGKYAISTAGVRSSLARSQADRMRTIREFTCMLV